MRSAWIIFLLVLAMTTGAGASDSGPDGLDDQIAAHEKENATLKKTIRLEALKKENASLRSQLGLASAAERPKAVQSADRQSSTVSASEALAHVPTKARGPTWPAIAKDKAAPLPPALVPVASWTGFYAGVNAGGGWGTKQINNSVINNPCPVNFFCFATGASNAVLPGQFATHPHGFIGGGQIGYNYQLAPNWVAGIETDFQGANLRGKADANNVLLPFVDVTPPFLQRGARAAKRSTGSAPCGRGWDGCRLTLCSFTRLGAWPTAIHTAMHRFPQRAVHHHLRFSHSMGPPRAHSQALALAGLPAAGGSGCLRRNGQ